QIIFYNETPRMMELKSGSRNSFYSASDSVKRNVEGFVRQIVPELGTRHFEAIQLALNLSPDVLFLLTDSGDPNLTPQELDEIRRRNGGRTHIHCVEFGVGPDLSGDADHNFLRKLANQNAGTHCYIDVAELSAEQDERR